MEYTTVTAAEFTATKDLLDWRVVLKTIRAEFRAGSFPAAAALVTTISDLAEAAEHHPDIDIRYPDRVRVALTTHATNGLTTLDIDLARAISDAAAECGATTDLDVIQTTEIAIDTLDADRIRPFWAAAMGYNDIDGQLVDPLRAGPQLWFQQLDEPRPGRGRLHLDVSVAHDAAVQRVSAALDAGGTLVSEDYARAWWVLADADGNEVCICTWQDRD